MLALTRSRLRRRGYSLLVVPVIAGAALLPQCSIGAHGTDVVFGSSLTVFHKHEGPGTQQIPWVQAKTVANVIHPPRGGTVTMVLWYRNGLIGTWKFAGRRYFSQPWTRGTKTLVIDYPCNRNNSYWRINFTWDVILHDGTPYKSPRGGENYPNGRGQKMTCIVYGGTSPAAAAGS
jgi:hypothetical protein